MKSFWTICLLQCLVILVLFFGDIGFDKPGKWGLDFEHFLILSLVQGCLFIAAVVTILRSKKWIYASVQIFLALVTAMAVVIN